MCFAYTVNGDCDVHGDCGVSSGRHCLSDPGDWNASEKTVN